MSMLAKAATYGTNTAPSGGPTSAFYENLLAADYTMATGTAAVNVT